MFYSLAVCSKLWSALLQFSHSRIMDGWDSHDASPVPALLHLYNGAFSQVKDSVMFLSGECLNY